MVSRKKKIQKKIVSGKSNNDKKTQVERLRDFLLTAFAVIMFVSLASVAVHRWFSENHQAILGIFQDTSEIKPDSRRYEYGVTGVEVIPAESSENSE